MITKTGIDFIGDIHGHAEDLKALLKKLGYSKNNGTYTHPERTAFFVGDYIDRGPEIPKTLDIVRGMVDAGQAKTLMGNHEYNAICFHQEDKTGGHLRKHSIKNILQHIDTLEQFQNHQDDYNEYIEWFKTLPLFYETENFRVVHACWDQDHIQLLKGELEDGCLPIGQLPKFVEKGTELYNAVNDTLKGKELELPEGHVFLDKDNNERNKIRFKWWEKSAGHTYRSISVKKNEDLPDEPVVIDNLLDYSHYAEENKPVFFGHYWLSGNPSLYRNNICCLDYSVAEGGKLVAYRFDGEERLSDEKLVFV